jgi:hypothetical protein
MTIKQTRSSSLLYIYKRVAATTAPTPSLRARKFHTKPPTLPRGQLAAPHFLTRLGRRLAFPVSIAGSAN